jgi:enoyl-CoA hydratase
MGGAVQLRVADAVARVTVDHPPVNALAGHVLEALGEVAVQLVGDSGVRAVVISGAGGRSFVAGADLKELAPQLSDAGAMKAHVQLTARVFDAWTRLPMPTIAAVSGHAVGGGLELALACDMIVAASNVRLGFPEVTLGLIPGAGGTQRLPRRVGMSASTRMLMTGELVTSTEALEMGLVDVVADEGGADDSAVELAVRLAEQPGHAMTALKSALRAVHELPLASALETERRLFLGVAATADAREGTSAFLARRRPRFTHV